MLRSSVRIFKLNVLYYFTLHCMLLIHFENRSVISAFGFVITRQYVICILCVCVCLLNTSSKDSVKVSFGSSSEYTFCHKILRPFNLPNLNPFTEFLYCYGFITSLIYIIIITFPVLNFAV